MSEVLWIIVGIIIERLIDRFLLPMLIKIERKRFGRDKALLYSDERVKEYVKAYYENKPDSLLADCRIGNTSYSLPYLISKDLDRIDVDIFNINNVLQLVNTEKCQYPIRKKTIRQRKRIGQNLFDDDSLFLHRIRKNGNNICFEVGSYSYFQRLSFFSDFESETLKNSLHKRTKSKLRDRYLANFTIGSQSGHNVIPIGCDVALLVKYNDTYHVAIHYRSSQTANYSNSVMLVPSFGLGDIAEVDNPLLFSFYKEYAEEVFNHEEVVTGDFHSSKEWFYEAFDEVKQLITLVPNDTFFLRLIGCGFDLIGGFFNLSLLAIISDEVVAKRIMSQAVGNWETDHKNGKHISFVPLFSKQLEDLFLSKRLSASSSYTISRAIEWINQNIGE